MNSKDIHINFDHRPAAHCETGVTSNLLRFYNINLSEAMVFGIGSGLYFGFIPFIKVNGIPLITFRPWMGTIFSKVNHRLGVRFQRKEFKIPGSPWRPWIKTGARHPYRLQSRGIPSDLFPQSLPISFQCPQYRSHRKGKRRIPDQ